RRNAAGWPTIAAKSTSSFGERAVMLTSKSADRPSRTAKRRTERPSSPLANHRLNVDIPAAYPTRHALAITIRPVRRLSEPARLEDIAHRLAACRRTRAADRSAASLQ